MRLLKRESSGWFGLTASRFRLTEFNGNNLPCYAVLSHTWGQDAEEVTFEDLVNGTGRSKAGYEKLNFCADQAFRDGLLYFWVDTCCINKASSSELQESVNSMFRWYRDAAKCYVYLSDISISKSTQNRQLTQIAWKSAFEQSRWFTRGWTLQELIAPQSVEFFSKEGNSLGDKKSLGLQIHKITGIALLALQGRQLSEFGVDERMLWAKNRETTRPEDAAYSLLGIFDIHMPLIYGEGQRNAMVRLEKAIRESLNLPTPFSEEARKLGGHEQDATEFTSDIASESSTIRPSYFASALRSREPEAGPSLDHQQHHSYPYHNSDEDSDQQHGYRILSLDNILDPVARKPEARHFPGYHQPRSYPGHNSDEGSDPWHRYPVVLQDDILEEPISQDKWQAHHGACTDYIQRRRPRPKSLK